jgi:hypothetical protein
MGLNKPNYRISTLGWMLLASVVLEALIWWRL